MRHKMYARFCGCRNEIVRLVMLVAVIFGLCVVFLDFLKNLNVQRNRTFAERCTNPTYPNQLPSSQQVLLVTYGRSGSSFTSALIGHHRDVLYVFEPLWVFKRMRSGDLQGKSLAILDSFMKCDFPPEHAFALYNRQFRLSNDTADMFTCLETNQTGVDHVTCFLKFLSDCRNHTTWFAKTIRFRVKWAETILKRKPNFKLLFLVRDPRATLFSQAIHFKYFDWSSQVENASREHCSLVENDLTEVDRLLKLFPGRVKSIRYEDGATDPKAYTKDIYNFLGLDYSNDTRRYIDDITRAGKDTPDVNARYSVMRQDSVGAMNAWRKHVDFKSVKTIDTVCGHLYSKLGYKFVRSNDDLKTVHSLVETVHSLVGKPGSESFLKL